MATKKPKAPAKKAPAKKAVGGRPTLYCEALAEKICTLLADKFSMRQICIRDDMPDRSTVQRWMADKPDFAAKCACAREEQADYIVEDCVDIEERTISGEINPAAARAVLASKQWRASKLAPKKYGDKIAVGGADDLPEIKSVHSLSTEALLAIAAKAS